MNSSFFTTNRSRLTKVLGKELIVMAGNSLMQRSNDMSFPFEQEANFWWLTGIEAPDWTLIIDGSAKKSYLIAPEVDAVHQVFDGSLDWQTAKRISGVDKVISNSEGKALFVDLAKRGSGVWTLGKDPSVKYYDFSLNPGPVRHYTKLKRLFHSVNDCRLELARLRAIKQPPEIEAIRRAIALTVDAFNEVKQQLLTYRYEYEIEAAFSNAFRRKGAKGHAYDPIVASGSHACTLHYMQNDDQLKQAELLLLDIGARVGGYAADITRTYQIGKATVRQKEVHAAVESAHQEIIALLKPGLAVSEYQRRVDEIMQQKLRQLGLLEYPGDYRKYFPHAISHGLGVDVHDALGRPTEFLEGMVLTVEPGIYIPEEGIGVRIEDNILITRDGHENLSAALPTSL
jgi:Xaa-Pro aminopeptidase